MNVAFIDHVAPGTTEAELKEVFEYFGDVTSVKLNKTKYFNQTITFESAFVRFSDSAEYNAALDNKQPLQLNGRFLTVAPADIFQKSQISAVLLGNTYSISPQIVKDLLSEFHPISVSTTYANNYPFFVITFELKNQRDAAVKANKVMSIDGRMYSLREFGTIPEFPSASGLRALLASNPKESVVLIHDSKEYSVIPAIGASISGLIRRKLAQSHYARNVIELDNLKGDFQPIHDVLCLKRANFTNVDPTFLYFMAAHLEIPSLMKFVEQDYYNTLSESNIISNIHKIEKYKVGLEPHVQYLASHLSDFIKNPDFLKLNSVILKQVASSSYMQDDQELIDQMWKLVMKDPTDLPYAASMKELWELKRGEYIRYIADDNVDLNKCRDKFIRLAESGARIEPSINVPENPT